MKNMVNVHPATGPVSVKYRALFEEVGGVTPEIIDVNESFLVLFFLMLMRTKISQDFPF